MTQDVYRRRPGHVLGNLVEAGRDLVHGAAGARPGSQRRRNGGGISQVSRWVGEGINWLLEEDSNSSAQETTLREGSHNPRFTGGGAAEPTERRIMRQRARSRPGPTRGTTVHGGVLCR